MLAKYELARGHARQKAESEFTVNFMFEKESKTSVP